MIIIYLMKNKKNPDSELSGFSAISIVYKKYSEFSKHVKLFILFSFDHHF